MPCALDPRGCRDRGCSWGCLKRTGSAAEDSLRLQAKLGAPLVSRQGAGTVEVGGARALGVEVGVGCQYAPYRRCQCGGVLEDSGGDSRAGHVLTWRWHRAQTGGKRRGDSPKLNSQGAAIQRYLRGGREGFR